jgi:hypothetical protein
VRRRGSREDWPLPGGCVGNHLIACRVRAEAAENDLFGIFLAPKAILSRDMTHFALFVAAYSGLVWDFRSRYKPE